MGALGLGSAFVEVRVSIGCRRMVWSKMKIRDAPVLFVSHRSVYLRDVEKGLHVVEVTYASLRSCSVSG